VAEMECWDLFKDSLMYNKPKWLEFIQSWNDDKNEYIREVGFPYRKVTRDLEQTFRQLLFFSAQMHNATYMTIFAFRKMKYVEDAPNPQRKHIPDYTTAIVNKIYWECDADHKRVNGVFGNLDDAYEDTMKMMDYYGDKIRVYYSGNRGFHLYLDIVPCVTKDELRSYSRFISDGLGISEPLGSIDCGHFGDTSRIYRIPYVPHHKTGLFTVPINRNMSLKDILEFSKICHVPKPLVRHPKTLDIDIIKQVVK